MAKVRMLTSLSLLCYQVTVLAKVMVGDFKIMRLMRVKMA